MEFRLWYRLHYMVKLKGKVTASCSFVNSSSLWRSAQGVCKRGPGRRDDQSYRASKEGKFSCKVSSINRLLTLSLAYENKLLVDTYSIVRNPSMCQDI